MPIFLNKNLNKRLPQGKRRAAPVRSPRRVSLEIRRAIGGTMRGLIEDVENLIPWLSGVATPSQAARVLRDLQDRWRTLYGADAQRLSTKWVAEVSRDAKLRLEKNIARSLGIDTTAIFDDKAVFDAAELMSVEARGLITTIPDEYLDGVTRAVLDSYQQIPQPEGRSLAEQIKHLSGATDTRARIIARDQTSKINTAINQARQQEIGIEEYIWRTRKDTRVVGKPGGLYPNGNRAHGNHWEREGQVYRWDRPPADGHPGYAINCRCFSEPIIDVSKLRNAI